MDPKDQQNSVFNYNIYDTRSTSNARPIQTSVYDHPLLRPIQTNYLKKYKLLTDFYYCITNFCLYFKFNHCHQIPVRIQQTQDNVLNPPYGSNNNIFGSKASSGSSHKNSTYGAAIQNPNRPFMQRVWRNLGMLIPPPKITSEYSIFKIPVLSQRFPFFFNNFFVLVVLVSIVIVLCTCLILYFALANPSNCNGKCTKIGKSGLYLYGFGKTSISTVNITDPGFEYSCNVYKPNMQYYALLNIGQFGEYQPHSTSPSCNKCVVIYGPSRAVRAVIVGACSDCAFGDISLSKPAFDYIKPRQEMDSFPISWGPC
ncbi:hypothetical protein BB560_003414 [Smittium megazygosporum]|uniref:RlpA-like protein double-psi beta-barrel domain-containing protein n=1 Tax=Smittium megazygosporum TaxID=133381 RepID=A0A2T9ZC29_9FUNG|nr:hypothetical protein BB560_003414 [Smittium megazygosporum]